MTRHTNASSFLRKALRWNAIFSGISGATFLIASGLVAVMLDAYDHIGKIHLVGANLLAFSGFLFYLASRASIAEPIVIAVIAADALWVGGSWLAIAAGMTSGGGTWAVAVVADIVALFAILQWLGLRKAKAETSAAT